MTLAHRVGQRLSPWYLSGPMSGYAGLNFPLFHRTAAVFRAHGIDIINPVELCPATTDWETAMAIDLAVMRQAVGMLMLPEWEFSRGARLEWAWARALGLPRLPVHVGWMLLRRDGYEKSRFVKLPHGVGLG